MAWSIAQAMVDRMVSHSMDYEKTTLSSESITYIAMIFLMSKRLAKAEN